MKYIVLLMTFFLVIAGCTAPPEDAPRAEVADSVEPAPEPAPVESSEEMMNEESDPLEDSMASGTTEGSESMSATMTKAFSSDSVFGFEGYGPGKSHVGQFDSFEGSLSYEDGAIVGATITVDANSVNTGIERLDGHLKTEDFFETDKYPEIVATSSVIDPEKGTITGDLTFHGVTKEITFPANISSDKVTTDFVLDTTPFNVDMAGGKANKEVRIFFTLIAE